MTFWKSWLFSPFFLGLHLGLQSCSGLSGLSKAGPKAESETSKTPGSPVSKISGPSLVILYMSDLHSRIASDSSGRAGYARLAQWIRSEKAQAGSKTDVLVLAGGDLIGKGGLPCSLTQDRACAPLLKNLQIDYATLGNHELQRDYADLESLVAPLGIRWIANNISRKGGEQFWSSQVELYQGPKSGLSLGLAAWASHEAFSGLNSRKNIDANDLQAWKTQMQAKSWLLMTHQELAEDLDLLKSTCSKVGGKNLLALLKANDHQEKFVDHSSCAPIFEPGPFGRNILRMVLLPSEGGLLKIASSEFVSMDSQLEKASDVEESVLDIYKKQAPQAREILGNLSKDYSIPEVAQVLADAYRIRTRADIAIVNVGHVKDTWRAGSFTYEDLVISLPYKNELVGLDWSLKEMEKQLCKAALRTPESNLDHGSELFLSGAQLLDAGTPRCRLIAEKRSQRQKVVLDNYLVSRSERWLGGRLDSKVFRFGVDSHRILSLHLQKGLK